MKINFSILVLILIGLFACNSANIKNENIAKQVNSDSVSYQKFVSDLNSLEQKYPENFKTSLNLKSENGRRFYLFRRLFIPQLDSLTLDLRQYQACSGCWNYRFLHIHNNDRDFLLPLTDDHVYWQQSGKNSQQGTNEKLIFNDEFNLMLTSFNLKDIQKIEQLLTEVMLINNFQKINQFDIPKLKAIFNSLKTDSSQSDGCRSNLETSLNKTIDWLEKKALVYSNGIDVYKIDINNNNSVSITTLNTNCNYLPIF